MVQWGTIKALTWHFFIPFRKPFVKLHAVITISLLFRLHAFESYCAVSTPCTDCKLWDPSQSLGEHQCMPSKYFFFKSVTFKKVSNTYVWSSRHQICYQGKGSLSGSQSDTGFSPQANHRHTGPWPQSQGGGRWRPSATRNRTGQSHSSKPRGAPPPSPAGHPGFHTLLRPPHRRIYWEQWCGTHHLK